MHQMVKDYLQKQETERAEINLKAKNELLLNLDLYEKEYSTNSKYSSQYPEVEWDEETQCQKYYRKKPIEISDEEYREILKYQNRDSIEQSSPISKVFDVIAWLIFIAGFIGGILCGNGGTDTHAGTEFSFAIAFSYWVISFACGMIFIGFAEIIRLLAELNKNRT